MRLFTHSTAVKLANALNKPLSYQRLSTFYNHIESANKQQRKSEPPILSTSHCKFNGTRSCAHAQKTIPLAPIHPFTKRTVPLLYP